MKPDKSGTWTQQVMFRSGWTSKASAGKECKGCTHLNWTGGPKPRCLKHDFLTQVRATCPSFEYPEDDREG